MNKSAIKNFAMRARNNLMAAVEQKAFEIGVTRSGIKDIETFQGGFRVNDRVFKASEVEQRKKLIQKIREKGFDQVIEEVAYTWFNRFIALRFMEVNEYLPTGIRVLSSTETNKTEPDIIREALNIELDIDKNVVYQYQDKNDIEGLFKYLLIKQCNELAKIMPVMFEEIEDYTELLLPDHLLTEGSVIRDLIESIEEEDFKEQVEIIGWLYQYYISEKKDEVFEGLKKNVKITKENIPAATQLFTPDWIVKYMVENSLGRLWLESHPNEELKAEWKYYLEEAEQEPEVEKQLSEIRNKDINPEEIKVLDPAMGSGHILVYAFDVLYEIYKSAGYPEREIPKLILEKNLYGLDIDDRAGQLAYFALMMKARSKNRRIFRDKIELNLCSIQESNGFPREAIDLLINRKDTELEKVIHRKDIEYIIEVFHDAKEYGSILDVKNIDFEVIEKRIDEIKNGHFGDLLEFHYRNLILEKFIPLLKQLKIMSLKYEIVCTNPPYMGNGGMNKKLDFYVKQNFENSKTDLYTVFIEKCLEFCLNNNFVSMITQHSWMFIARFENLRNKMFNNTMINSMVHLGTRAFEEIGGEVVQSTCFVIKKRSIPRYNGMYVRLVDYSNASLKIDQFFNKVNRYSSSFSNMTKIPGIPLVYWISKNTIEAYNSNKFLGDIAKPRIGMVTGDTNRFLRLWHEVDINKVKFDANDRNEAKASKKKWFPYNKGGAYRKWYGNLEYIVNWENDGYEILNDNSIGGRVRSHNYNLEYSFVEGITWTKISSGPFAARYSPKGFLFDDAGPLCYIRDREKLLFVLGLLSSKIGTYFLNLTNPTMNYLPGDIIKIPLCYNLFDKKEIYTLVEENIELSRSDWDSFETSWDFKRHPFIEYLVKNNFVEKTAIKGVCNDCISNSINRFDHLRVNEEKLNNILVEIYGLQSELTDTIEESDININKGNIEKYIKSFISYAIGCIFGRFSLDEEGLIYAGGDFNKDRYRTFKPIEDNILPIADDVYFEEDIVTRFIDFVRATFGEKTLEENLDYIAETLNKKPSETSRQAIRRYFLNDFYKDHVQVYKKRPIYWLFDSGKQNGFKALIYMHRYDPYTVARVRTDYLHKLQKKYDAEINRLDIVLESNVSQAEKTKARKKKEDLIKKMQECTVYDQSIAHVANQKIEIDLDDGVAVNYVKFQGVEIPQGEGKKPLKADLLAKI